VRALLADLYPSGVERGITVDVAARRLRNTRPATLTDQERRRSVLELIEQWRWIDVASLPSRSGSVNPEEFLGESDFGRAVFETVSGMVSSFGDKAIKTTKSQIAFTRRRGFVDIWLPGLYLARPQAEVVVSIALDRAVASPRFKEIAHPSAGIWQHHLEVRSVDEVDDEVRSWLRAAYDCAG